MIEHVRGDSVVKKVRVTNERRINGVVSKQSSLSLSF